MYIIVSKNLKTNEIAALHEIFYTKEDAAIRWAMFNVMNPEKYEYAVFSISDTNFGFKNKI